MTENELPPDHPLRDSRVHALMGLITGTLIASIGILVFDGLMMWALIGLGVFDALSTPYIFGKVMDDTTEPGEPAEEW